MYLCLQNRIAIIKNMHMHQALLKEGQTFDWNENNPQRKDVGLYGMIIYQLFIRSIESLEFNLTIKFAQ